MEQTKEKINVGIGFATGRKSFKSVLQTYINNWSESGLLNHSNIDLHLFIAYDLSYRNTKAIDYHITDAKALEMLSSIHYLDEYTIEKEARSLASSGVVSKQESTLLFTDGYAGKRNMIVYSALKSGMDQLIFLDDDEYPVAAIKTNDNLTWMGQEVVATHIEHLKNSDVTHGHHCGYISPIPSFEFNQTLSEDEFRMFIEAISNDIISWDSIKAKMENGGVQYADIGILQEDKCKPVEEAGGMKFVSGANLGLNLTDPSRLYAFYNPPGARGEDTFFGTCLCNRDVQKVPCYTFHDGFAVYNHLLYGTLPRSLKAIQPDSDMIRQRFYKAAIGWVRYKPLLMYITRPISYQLEMDKMRENLQRVIPKLCEYFDNKDFQQILNELDYYCSHVVEHYRDFRKAKSAWGKIMDYLDSSVYAEYETV